MNDLPYSSDPPPIGEPWATEIPRRSHRRLMEDMEKEAQRRREWLDKLLRELDE